MGTRLLHGTCGADPLCNKWVRHPIVQLQIVASSNLPRKTDVRQDHALDCAIPVTVQQWNCATTVSHAQYVRGKSCGGLFGIQDANSSTAIAEPLDLTLRVGKSGGGSGEIRSLLYRMTRTQHWRIDKELLAVYAGNPYKINSYYVAGMV
eukprot:scaffold2267_cov102-Skeletonema_dohrnii-CCMP3373.AAC.1